MTGHSTARSGLVAVALATAVLGLQIDPTAAADVRLFTSGAPTEVQKGLVRTFAETTGHRLVITSGTLGVIQERLAGPETPDVVVLPAPAIEALDKAGKLRPGSRIRLARVGIGVAVRAGAPLPDVSTVDAVRKMLIEARSIVHPDPQGGGFTGAHIARMIERMGLADVVKPKLTLLFAVGGGVAAVAKGDAEVGLFNVSEILPVPGVALAGALPSELQNYITFAGAVHAGSAAPEAAAAYLKLLSGARDAWKAGGFESLEGAR